MTTSNLIKRVLPLVLSIAAIGTAQAAVPSFDLGAASNYSAYIYGNVSKVTDIEGRLAVGGDFTASGTSIGYRAPYGSTGPSLVVGGNVSLSGGDIYAPPKSKVDTTVGYGPITSYTKALNGKGVYGGTNTSSKYHNLTQKDISKVTDFAATKTSLTALSNTLSKQASNGTSVKFANGGISLVGNGKSGVEVFNLDTNNLTNLTLSNVAKDAIVLINVTGTGTVTFGGGQDGQLEALRNNVLFNLNGATGVQISTFTWGSILANNADLTGTGHLEGSIVAKSISSAVEVGWEPFKGYVAQPVPEPETYAMMLAGLALVGGIARRRRQQQGR
ncbi:choice-of-anchor A family protein [Pseudoduganella danionis]|uniref:Choice-of-anchor A family protein n=1 Tax=Pseudoduganella danionis TaxID=1890295 RepID=A0ABW9SKP7_9BURK|nr:choice-of-anchor A family protein [Pseudoduganella danionis]MTW32748.1 choice-of-anchor A family protein [Pseudoduganella danionis]